MAHHITEVEGIGPSLSEKLGNAGITTVEEILDKGATPTGREMIAEQSGIDERQILRFVNMADLFRINGVGGEYAELLEAAGVDTVKELRNRVPRNLQTRMAEINEERSIVRRVPTLEQVRDFVDQAKELDPVVTY